MHSVSGGGIRVTIRVLVELLLHAAAAAAPPHLTEVRVYSYFKGNRDYMGCVLRRNCVSRLFMWRDGGLVVAHS